MSGPIGTAVRPDKAIAVIGTHPRLRTSAKTKVNADDVIDPSSDGSILHLLEIGQGLAALGQACFVDAQG
jgi:hypothetical protein